MSVRHCLAAAALVGSSVFSGCQASTGGGGEASCAAAVELDGVTYWGTGELRRTPGTTGRTLSAVLPGCDDSGGQDDVVGDEAVEVEELTGLDPGVAVLFHDSIYVRDGEDLPPAARAWFRAPRCSTAEDFEVTADWLGVTGPEKPRSDGDLRPPYRLEVRVTEGPEQYVGTTITLRVTPATDPALSPADVEASLWEGGQVVATVRCLRGSYDVLGVTTTGPGRPPDAGRR